MALPAKADLRKEFLAKRNALDPEERTRHSSLIRQRVFGHPAWKKASTILCYVSFGSEVETHLLIQEALRFKKRIIVPLHDPAKTNTLLSELKRFPDLSPGHRGVLQLAPELQQLIEPKEVELAIVPGIVFDRTGLRIGFGGGYFDRLLPLMPQVAIMGLAFDAQISPKPLPGEPHDVKMHTIMTEKAPIQVQ